MLNNILEAINYPVINEFINIFIIDLFLLSYHRIFNITFKNTTRWFLLHSVINSIVTYYSINDVKTCIEYSNECYNIKWNDNSVKVYNYAFMLHVYHCIFFTLTADDILHHTLMVAICGTLCYKIKSILSSLALFFLSGLPGAIDYFLLYLVKKNMIHSITEKKLYTLLSAYIRSPGCLLTFFIGMHGVYNYYIIQNYYQLSLLLLIIVLIFWNGQYYLLQYHESYIKKSI